MQNYVFNVEGMMCEHCSARLQKVLEGTEGVASADVRLEEKKAYITAEEDFGEKLKAVIEEAGFEVTE